MVWLSRALFLGLLYYFLFRLYKALVGAHAPDGRRLGVAGDLVVIEAGAAGGVWIEDGRAQGRRLHEGEAVPVRGRLTAGRASGNAIRVEDPFVSGRHFVVVGAGGRFFIEDLRTTNGTRVDGRPVRGREPLRPGAVIEVGRTRFRFEVK